MIQTASHEKNDRAVYANSAVRKNVFPTQRIDELLFSAEPKHAMQDLAEYLKKFAAENLRSMLQLSLTDSHVLRRIAERSYFHGNGFYKVVLVQDERFKLRLHIWMPGCHAEENIHEHRWHFASTILHGQLESEIWQEASRPEAKEFDEILYFAQDQDSPPFQVANGKTKLLCSHKVVRVAGEAYAMPPGVLHRIVSTGKGLTATLMCQAAPARRWNRLIPYSVNTPDTAQRFLSVEALCQVIHQFLAHFQTN